LETFAWDKPVSAINCVTFFSPFLAAKINLRRLTSLNARNLAAIASMVSPVKFWKELLLDMAI
jgi:hypothetical protein